LHRVDDDHDHSSSSEPNTGITSLHANAHGSGILDRLQEAIPFFHGHTHGDLQLDEALESSDRGIRALQASLLLLAGTALFQVVVVLMSGSVALLSDTVHNFTDAMTAVPLWIAFSLGRRVANRRYTYGYGRAEDVAGVLIVLFILSSAIFAVYESYDHLVNPRPLENLGWVIAAALIGFAGNEAVALLRIRVGREIGSAALVADGQHARIDGLTSLAVLGGAAGVLAGFERADPIVGLAISAIILFIVKDATVAMWHRLMDAIDPEVIADIESVATATIENMAGVQTVSDLRVRWLGHKLQAEMSITVDEEMSTRSSHHCAEEVRHALFHARPQLTSIIVHIEPDGRGGDDPHRITAHHEGSNQ
jgi:cation diffusion facilitator family transporter